MRRWGRAGALALVVVSVVTVSTSAGRGEPGHALPPERLSDTGLATLGRPFAPQYPLWSDGATKTRWVYLPPGATIDAVNESEWELPVGTRFWKEFAFNGRKVETRFLWRASPTRWVATSYVWNEEGTEAVRAPEDGVPGIVDVAPGRRHTIPSTNDCLACHGARKTGPLGFNALQLSTDRDPNAIHGETLPPNAVTFATLLSERRLVSPRSDVLATLAAAPPRIQTNHAATRSALGYLFANCGGCHNGAGEIAAFGPTLRQAELLRDGDAVARSLVGQVTKWQVPGVAEGSSVVIDAGRPETSALLVRMRSRRPSSQMPPLGTVLRDETAVATLSRWVSGDLVASHKNTRQ